MKVGASNPTAPTIVDVTPEVRLRAEVASTASIDVIEGGSLPSESVDLSIGDHASDPSVDKEREKGKGRLAVVKVAYKARPDEPTNSGSDDLGPDPFGNSNIN